MRVIIAGNRTFNDYEFLKQQCNDILHGTPQSRIQFLSGGATGADALGERYARECWSKDPQVFPADWETHGNAAGPIRNKQMAENADMLIAFWDGKSKGTGDMIKQAYKMKLDVERISLLSDEV